MFIKLEQNIEVMVCAVDKMHNSDSVSTEVDKMREGFVDIFVEPKGLPPFRENHNHKILLKEGADPINQRPYR